MGELPRGTVTLLFTDIEGSTRLLLAQPEAYRSALDRHNTVVERAIGDHGGVVFNRAGDSFAAAFTSPRGALCAALDAQTELERATSVELAPLRVRMALHTGDVGLQGGQYFGLALHRCARLMSSVHGGQVILSAATAALVEQELPSGVSLADLGVHRLRDLALPERIYQLCAPGLQEAHPPLQTSSVSRNTLPVQLTPFIGRERQIEAVCSTLLAADTRLLTLTGPGGTGKTRLALQAAAELLDSFPDGIHFVALAAVTDPDLVASAVAQALTIREAPGRPLLDSVRDALRQKQTLLILDNFEQVIDAAPGVADLLAAAPGLKVLVTSRAILRLYGEREYPVPPLALPDRRAAPSAAHLVQFEAVRLFVDRARAARPDFALTDENAADVAEICHRLDGLPLAVELAAARIRALSLPAMLQRMERRLPLLTGGARDLPARQRTLRDAIAWSYDLLEPDEQALFRRLGVFRGCTLETAEAVCAGEPPGPGTRSVALPPLGLEILDGIESLVEKSLLRREEGFDGQPWYLMLETVREFALEQLDASGETGAVCRRHALTALRLAEASEPGMYGSEQATWLAHLEQEHDNLRAALDWCQTQGYAEPALRLAVALWSFWNVHGHMKEGRERLDGLLARFPIGASSSRAALGARAIFAAATLASIQGDQARARTLHEEGLSIRRAIDDQMGVLVSLEGLGLVYSLAGDHRAANTCLEEAMTIARVRGDRFTQASLLSNLGNIAYEAGDLSTARQHFEACNTLLQVLGVTVGQIGSHLALALVAQDQGDYDKSQALASTALARYRETGNRRMQALALAILGGVALARGDHASSREHLGASIAMQHELGDVAATGQVLERYVELAAAQGRPEGAVRLAAAATALRERAGANRSRTGQEKLDRVLGPARAALDTATAEAAWQAGLALDPDEAAAAALAITAPDADSAAPADSHAGAASAESGLTPRELQVAAQVARGLTNRQIAEALVIGEGTVATHVNRILGKLGFNGRAQIAAWAAQHGLS